MNADGARHLRQPRDGLFHVGLVEHHQVGQLVDDDQNLGQRLVLVFVLVFEQARRVVKELVVLVEVAHAFFRQHF